MRSGQAILPNVSRFWGCGPRDAGLPTGVSKARWPMEVFLAVKGAERKLGGRAEAHKR